MKERFTTIDVFSVVQDLRERKLLNRVHYMGYKVNILRPGSWGSLAMIKACVLGMRVANVYDVDHKTYLIKLAKPDVKQVLLFESGCRIHTTEFEWPKGMQPSGFSMKLRKHLRTRRLVAITQLGIDRVLDLQFGSDQAAYHLIIELYDRGNVILTDCNYIILSLLRTRTDADAEVRFAVRETFSQDTVKREQPLPSRDQVQQMLSSAKKGDQLKHVLNPHFVYGTALLTHCLLEADISDTARIGSGFNPEEDIDKVMCALEDADQLFRRLRDNQSKPQGIVVQKREPRPQMVDTPAVTVATGGEGGDGEQYLLTNVEFHPMLFRQHERCPYREFPTLSKAVDEFFSSKSSQKQDLKALNVQKTAVKKLDNVRRDHQKRIDELQKKQEEDKHKAQLIEFNIDLVDRASVVIRSAIANAMDWGDIELLVKDAQARGDPVASVIHSLKLSSNEITLLLKDPVEDEEEEVEEGEVKGKRKKLIKGTKIDIDLGLSAFSNARRYYDNKKSAFKKEQKTMAASEKALKSAEKKTKQTLKDASTIAKIKKARKVHWFEKFFWFISSENFLVIGGRDQQQNEIVVKRYLKDSDLYVHADLHGAPSVIIKNPQGGPVPPQTLNEAGSMAVCYSSAWESRIVTSAWWVHSHQVSKTAPAGEYLTTGSFMIRGRKNFLPPCDLTMGFGFLFKVDETCISRHLHERKIRSDDDQLSVVSDTLSELTVLESVDDEEELQVEDDLEQAEGEEEEEEEEESMFPDTIITLEHVGGGRFELQRGTSVASSRSTETEGGQQLPSPGEGGAVKEDVADKRHQHLSAKQRREMKRQGKQNGTEDAGPTPASQKKKKQQPLAQAQPPQVKRGQKAKQRKIRDKYGDQDEEERQMRMDILASGRPSKQQQATGKKGQKTKKDPNQSTNPKHKYHQKSRGKDRGQSPTVTETTHHKQMPPVFVVATSVGGNDKGENSLTPAREPKGSEMIVEDIEAVAESEEMVREGEEGGEGDRGRGEVGGGDGEAEEGEEGKCDSSELPPVDEVESPGPDAAEEKGTTVGTEMEEAAEVTRHEDSDDEEKKAILADENIQQLEDQDKDQVSVLDSFTGCPVPEDIMLYAIPVCAPYTAVTNYKHKVKLVPGANKRGKAARAALHRFIQSRESSPREKDLLKSVKDNDLSRYIPGKVKISIPQTQTHRHPRR